MSNIEPTKERENVMELLLTPIELLEDVRRKRAVVTVTRDRVLENAHRHTRAKSIAADLDAIAARYGKIEATIVEEFAKDTSKEDPNQTKIDVDKDLASTGHSRTHQGNVGGTRGA